MTGMQPGSKIELKLLRRFGQHNFAVRYRSQKHPRARTISLSKYTGRVDKAMTHDRSCRKSHRTLRDRLEPGRRRHGGGLSRVGLPAATRSSHQTGKGIECRSGVAEALPSRSARSRGTEP